MLTYADMQVDQAALQMQTLMLTRAAETVRDRETERQRDRETERQRALLGSYSKLKQAQTLN